MEEKSVRASHKFASLSFADTLQKTVCYYHCQDIGIILQAESLLSKEGCVLKELSCFS